jgi:hypothetical protein
MVMLAFATMAVIRHRANPVLPKKATPNHRKNKSIATPSLIRWSIQEVRRIATRLARKRIQPAHIIAWSLWRGAHQAAAQRAHFKAKRHAAGGSPADYRAGIERAIAKGWLWRRESGTYVKFTDAGAELFA